VPSDTSRSLLNWWFKEPHLLQQADGTMEEFQYFFAQREALETVVYLYDVVGAKDKFDLIANMPIIDCRACRTRSRLGCVFGLSNIPDERAMQLLANDLEHHWCPFTSNRDFKADPRLVVRAEGVYYWNHWGDKVLDGASGLFCVPAGHGRKEIQEAVAKQLGELDYGPHFQLGHPLSFELANVLRHWLPDELNYLFFTNSGSESVETALKVALAYHHARGEGHRTRLVGRERGYHGVNFGGMSVGGMSKNREAFGTGLPGVHHMRHTWLEENRFSRGEPEIGADLADDLQRFVDFAGAGTIAAVIVEPIAGGTGFLVPPKGYLKRLREICDRHGILLIFDEVICGFGRTGKPFASQSFDVTPDIITMAKALTNGTVPMGAVAFRDEIYHAVVDRGPDDAIELFHGYTYSGHPVACAAALASQKIYRDDELFERAAELSPYFLDALFSLKDIPVITDIRGYGMLGGIDIAPSDRVGQRGNEVMKRAFRAGLHIKATADALLVAPPFVAERGHIDEICDILRNVLEAY